ncbi:methyltransferase domain-containing protein [Treponema zuelzerae]|uniref:Methyltransferase domain-containing protein n=1 Tax=Teretinema zuelzerae TaxID=156 RepID=A0AAE3ELK4_9SPIR|nr:methyltransferase domain-containing protein [Teretinema zuelzerae]MCD1656106.1 methyltransferase domain-containing protein [Teretinema zuelzerae]
MELTLEAIKNAGYKLQAAEKGSWKVYNEENPVPGYFQFDWLSSRFPDLYHDFALSTVGLISKLHTIIDFSDMNVLDIGAGTGRSSIELSKKAKYVTSTDVYDSVMNFAKDEISKQGINNIHYEYGDRDNLPFSDSTFDAVTFSWAEVNHKEAYRVLKNNGYLIQMGSIPEALCGELTDHLNGTNNNDPKIFLGNYPDEVIKKDKTIFSGVPLIDSVNAHIFTYNSIYDSPEEVAAIAGRLYGPKAKKYFLSRNQNTFSWRMEILIGQVKK